MKKTILALAIIGITGIGFTGAATAQTLRLSELPPGAIHTPGIGPGYIFPSYGTDMAMGSSTMPATSMMPGAVMIPEPAMDSGEARALSILRTQGFTDVQDLRPGPNGSYHGLAMQRGGMAPVSVDRDGAVSIRQQ